VNDRKYVPAMFDLKTEEDTSWVHGQNFVIVAHTTDAIYVDTNWIDNETGRPVYWQITTGTTSSSKSTQFNPMQYSFDGIGKVVATENTEFQHGDIFIMPRK
jgi:hypothetical protein